MHTPPAKHSGVPVGVIEGLGVLVGTCVAVEVAVPVAVGRSVTVGVGVAVGVGPVGVAVGVDVGVAVSVCVGVPVCVAVGSPHRHTASQLLPSIPIAKFTHRCVHVSLQHDGSSPQTQAAHGSEAPLPQLAPSWGLQQSPPGVDVRVAVGVARAR
jgi:hypothetical protein